jgi:RimJ/RimL family protein N-acetyltransferase
MGHTPADDGREVFAAVLPGRLDGGDFLLRHAREDDVVVVVELVDDEMRERLQLPDVVDAAMTAPMILHGGALLIVDASTDAPLGGLRLFLHGDAVELGYWLGPGARGRGVATRALGLAADAVVERLRPSRLELRITRGNEASERVAERAGFRLVGPEPPIEYPAGRVLHTTLWVRDVPPG